MKKNLLLPSLFFLFSTLIFTSNVNAQVKDTITFDYDNTTYCLACNDYLAYNVSGTRDSFTDNTTGSYYLSNLKVKIKLFTCFSGTLSLSLNGNVVGTTSSPYNCACNNCDSITFNISALDIKNYYKYGQKNVFRLNGASSGLYIDRTIIYRTKTLKYNYDAGVVSVDSPSLYVCAGSKNVKVKIYNNGRKQFSAVSLDWKWNGTSQSTVNYSSSTLDTIGGAGSNTALVTLGAKTFSKGKKDTLMVWTKNPGGVADSSNFNDTVRYIFNGSYSDTIRVGGSSPHFSTIQAAVNALMSTGICSTTYVKIWPGTYNEQVSVGNIIGTSPTSPVIFLSANNDSSSVVINYSASSSDNYTLRLNNTNNIIFRRLTIEALNTSYSRVIDIVGNAENFAFINCALIGINTTSSSTRYAVVYRNYNSSYDKTKNIVFTQTRFENGSYGMYFNNSYDSYCDGFYVRNCLFENQYYSNLYLYYAKNVGISNTIFDRNNSSYYYGYGLLFQYVSDSLNFNSNRVIQRNGGYGIYCYNVIGSGSKRILFANNFVSTFFPYTYGSDDGIYLENSQYVDLVFNNVYRSSQNNSYYPLNTYNGNNLRFLYNNFYNDGVGKALNIYSGSNNSVEKSDRNNFYNNGNDLGSWYNQGISKIGDIKTLIGKDSNSVSDDPGYTSSTDLHAYNVFLDGRALAYNGITKDIDGETRNSTNPDIGADEFRLKSLDAGLVEFVRPIAGTSCAKVILRNYGSTTLTSVKIDWKLNGVAKSQVTWTGSLAKGKDTAVCLGNITFKRDTLYQFQAWSSAPNSGTDSIANNDTTSDNIYPLMSGVYTIGGTTPDFTTFAAAVAAVELAGIKDSVLFKVRNGTYTEQIEINEIYGATAKNSVIFESESKDSTKVILQYNSSGYSNNYVVYLNKASGISFRKMTLQNFSSYYRNVIRVLNGSKYIRIENNILQNGDSTSTDAYSAIIFSEYNSGKEIYFLKNIFNKGAMGIYLYGNSSSYENSLIVRDNTFKKQSYIPVYLEYVTNLEFSGNTVTSSGPNLYYGLYTYSLSGSSRIFNNKISISGNNADYGVQLQYYNGTDTLRFYNNFISISGNSSSMALYAYDLDYAQIYYNNILNESTDSSSNSAAIYMYYGNYKIYNNNLIHLKNGYGIYKGYTDFIQSNNNNIYTNGTKYVYWYGSIYSSLSAYKSATYQDTNSVEVDPLFTSSTDLHVAYAGLNTKAKPINYITKDIDGETRNATKPDIGADEFTPLTIDAGVSKLLNPGEVFRAGTTDVEVVVTNYGIDTIKNFTIQVKINKDTLTRKIITRNIKSGDTIHVKLGNYLFKSDSLYDLFAYTFLPNGVTDQKKSNDTLKIIDLLPALTGVYTIGGTTPNFPTFKAAISALKKAGMVDSVRFRVRTGTYSEQLLIPQIVGASGRNSIIFESQDQDSTKVTLQFGSSYSDTNYVVCLNGADGITFRYMKIKATSGSNYNRVFDIRGKAYNNTINKNIIEGPNTNWADSRNALIFSGQDADDYLQIIDNIIKNGDYGIYLYGYPTSAPNNYEKGLQITGNKILNPYYAGIYTQYSDTVDISGNYIYSDKYYYSYGIYLEYCNTNFKINRNTIDMRQGNHGIYLYECGTSFKRNLVSNNAIYLKNTSNYSYGLNSYYSDYIDYIHNSVNIDNPYTSSTAFYTYSGSNITLYNNIFSNIGTGYSVYINSSSTITKSNYNNLISKGSILGYWNGTNTTDLASWKTTTAKDTNSLSIDPKFKSVSNLHVKEVALNAAAKYFKSVPFDIDGDTRDTLKPDIGADEFNLPPNDAGIFKIIVPNKPFPSDTQQVKVVIKNYGGNPLYVADINWKFNGVTQTVKSWSDTLQSGDTMYVNLGKKFFHPDSAYSLTAWTSNPNGTGDSVKTNDTSKVINQYPALSGIYTIGGASPDFASFGDAVTAMKRGGIIDSVRFDVRSGTYYEQIKIPYIVGANSENDIIFQSELKDSSKVFLISTNTSSDNYTVRLDSTNGVTFRHMSLSTTGTYYYNRIFEILKTAKNINIWNCNITGSSNNTTSNSEALIYINNSSSDYPPFENIEIYNCRMTKGEYGIYAYGYSSIYYARDLDIHNNNMEDQYYMGIQLSYVNNFHINYNTIYHTSTSGYGNAYGIYAEYCNDGFEFTNNNIYNQEYSGVYLYNCSGKNQDTSLFANNFIHCRTNNNVYAIRIYYPNYLNFFNNNIHITSTNASSYAALFYSPSRTASYNNNFVSTGAGYAIYLDGTLTKSDYNNFYTTGSNLAYHNSSDRANLAAWKSSTSKDAKALSVNPDYVSNTDLHVRGTDLNAAGRNHKYILTKDIDGQKRDTLTPDIGADEFNIPAGKDAGISAYVEPVAVFAAGSRSVKVAIKNFGSDSLKSATIKWRVNGTMQTSYSWTGALKTGQTATATIGNYTFASGKKYDLDFWTTSPNGGNDTTNYNDTTHKYNVYAALDGVYTVGGTSTPDFAGLSEAFTALKLGGVADSVWFRIATGTYNTDLTIGPYPGAHPGRPVYIESQSGDSSDVIITNSGGSGQLLHITGADYLKFKKVTFAPVYAYGNNAVVYDNSTIGLSFENCYFDMTNSSYYYYYYSSYPIVSNSGKDDSLIVKNCRFYKGTYGIYTYSNSGNEKGINISNNLFIDQYSGGILMQYADAPKIRYNTISSSVSGSNAISSYYTGQELTISHNKIHYSQAGSTGIYIYNHTSSSTSKANIFNNFITLNGTSSSSRGINSTYSTYVNIFHNSINIYGSNTAASALYLYSGNNYDIRNNVLANSGGGFVTIYGGSPTIAQSNYNDLYTTGSILGDFNGSNKATLGDWKTATGKDANSLSLNPTFNSDYDLHTNLSSLDSACNPISGITDDIDLETRNSVKPDIGADEFQSLPENLGVSAFITPVSSCNLDSAYVKVRIFNFGNKSQVGFSVKYRIDGGTIKSGTVSDTIKPGKDVVFQFASKEPFALNTTYKLQAWSDLSAEKYRANDSLRLTFTNYSKPDSVKNMVPADGSTGIDFPFTLSWAPSTGATRYDVYVWPFAASRPSTPTLSNTTQISYQITGGLNYGDKYNWQIEARNPVCSTPGKVQTFTMRHLPDLTVEEVNAPNTAFSSNTISISWKIKNTGLGSASGSWYDAIFLSTDAVLDVTDSYLGAVVNPSALNPSQNYTQSASVNLPNGISGNYYIFIRTDEYNYIGESNNSNNSARDTGKMVVSLTPPPDLIVTSVTRPSVAFSGASTNLTYIVKNNGTGATRSGGWYDRIYLSTEKVLNGTSYNLRTNYHNGNLNVDSTYSVTSSVTIPNYISGKYFFVVYTDANNNEYEHASESNNTKGSDTIKVILTPPPDLIIKNLTTVDTASSSENILVKYTVVNDGGTTTGGGFYDAVYLCPTSTFNAGTSILLNNVWHGAINTKDSNKVSQYFTIPKGIKGAYYLFAFADNYNYINEVTNEGNNGNPGYKVFIKTPDLIVTRVVVSSTDTTGSTTPVNWTVKNKGLGNDYQGTRTDSIYISKFASWNRNNSTPVGSLRYSATILKDDTLPKNTTIRIPDGFDGNRYFFVVTDAAKEVYEPTMDTNNYKRSNLMNVILAPYPDLKPTFLSFPDSAKAGGLIGLGYRVLNQGKTKANPNWKDRLYFSKDSVFNLTKVTVLNENTRTTGLDTAELYEKTVYMTLPASMARGNYFYYIFTDADKDVYEHFNDSNNIIRTKKIFIDGYPPVDLRVNCPSIKDTMGSGSNYILTYSVTNIGQAKTAVSSWNDGAYLSADSVLSTGDILVATIGISKALEKDSTYNVSQSITIPNGLDGDYYLLIKTDLAKLIKDVDTTNNKKAVCKSSGGAKKLRINLTPPPDLRITSWNIPSTGTSGQPIKIKWKVENKGTGATRSGAWMDQFYLSTDYTIDGADYPLGEKRHTGNLAINGSYNDSNEFNIPLDKVGNFIVIIKTDGANVEYEHSNEGNNLVSSVTSLSKAPPADLYVSQVTSPDSVLSGKTINVNWKVKNKGSNPASGYMTDNVYLSLDNKQDAADLLLNSEQYYVSIAPNTDVSRSKTLSVSGVSIGNYYVLVTTDVLNNINEANDTNNTSTAPNLLNVNVPILPIAVKTKDTLTNGEKIYYRIEIPSNLEGESMLISLKADSVKGNNEIFVRHGSMVSGSEFDFKYREPFKGNQEIIIPELKQGTYYLLTTGQKTGTPNYQPIILFARIMPFEIRKVTPNKGGNTGEVTVLIEGSKLDDPTVRFNLLKTGSGYGSITNDSFGLRYRYSMSDPTSFEIVDPTMVFATFNLAGKDTGRYDVAATKGIDETAVLVKGFKVVPGNIGDLEVTVIRPGNTRASSLLYMDVLFTNSGNTDIINKTIKVVSSAGAPIALTTSDLSKNLTELDIVIQGNEGPANRLRPGGSGTVRVFTKSSAALGITILK